MDPVDQPVRAAVDVVAEHDVVAGLQHRAQQRVLGREPRGERERALAALERGELRLERGAGRVAGAAVLVAAAQPADAVLHERRGLVDRRDDRAGRRVELLAGVDGARGEAVAAVVIVCFSSVVGSVAEEVEEVLPGEHRDGLAVLGHQQGVRGGERRARGA